MSEHVHRVKKVPLGATSRRIHACAVYVDVVSLSRARTRLSLRLLRAAAAALAVIASSPARAEPVLALRVGIAPALGSASGNLPMSRTVPLQFPVQLDALWREGPIAGGLYGSWGPGVPGGCASGETCSARVWRAGAQGTWTFPASGLEPWAGVAAGWEWASLERDHGGAITGTWSGPELALQGGVEWRLGSWLALGPYALAGGGWYGRYGVESPAGSASATISDPSFHGWIHLGVRGRLVLGGPR